MPQMSKRRKFCDRFLVENWKRSKVNERHKVQTAINFKTPHILCKNPADVSVYSYFCPTFSFFFPTFILVF